MRQPDNTRCYQSFPSVIPVCRASSLRVTHPSALARLRKRSFANDLHVLSILSAFILSQDQTLHSIYFSYILFHLSFDEFLALQASTLDFYLYLTHCCFFYSYLLLSCDTFSYRQDIYYHIPSPLSTTFFHFFKFFSYMCHTVKYDTYNILKKHSKNDTLELIQQPIVQNYKLHKLTRIS